MDSRKALFRKKLREQKQEKRIDSPLVRYNECDQPICRVCTITLKSDSLWPAHQASRKHHEAIENLKANASGKNSVNVAKSDPPKEMKKIKESHPSSTIPADFFDKQEPKRQKTEKIKRVNEQESKRAVGSSIDQGFFEESTAEKVPVNKLGEAAKLPTSKGKSVSGALPEGFFDSKGRKETKSSRQVTQTPKASDGAEIKHTKGALPDGFFDNKDADLRARGIEPVKVDINDAYKEFEKEIHDDLQEVDDRLEEEEIDAAEVREEFDSLEQKEYREKVEMVKKRLMEVKSARHAKGKRPPVFMDQEESSEESSNDSDQEEENFTVDWRAKHL